MKTQLFRQRLKQTAIIASLAVSLGACNALDRIAGIGKAPELTTIQNPVQAPGYKPVSMPMPTPVSVARKPNSLWQEGSRAFFKDQRASQIGDILTVVIEINDDAEIENTTTRTRTNTETATLNNFLGVENQLGDFFSGAVAAGNIVDLGSTASNVGNGEVEREEEINLRVAAVVTQKLPNGNMVLFGRQEVRVNFEVREVVVGGVIRPEDISNENEINYDEMAEARIGYGGRGQLTDVQQPRYGTQLYDVIMPF